MSQPNQKQLIVMGEHGMDLSPLCFPSPCQSMIHIISIASCHMAMSHHRIVLLLDHDRYTCERALSYRAVLCCDAGVPNTF